LGLLDHNCVSKFRHSRADPGLRSPQRDSFRFRYFCGRASVHGGPQDGPALLDRQFRESSADVMDSVVSYGSIFRLKLCAQQATKHLVIGIGWGTSSRPKGVDGQIARDRQRPGSNCSPPRVKGSGMAKDTQKGFLGDVLGESSIDDDPDGESEKPTLVATDKDKSGPVVTDRYA
jgi:hypothetical protein